MPKPYIHAHQLGLVCFFAALLVRPSIEYTDPLPEDFSIRTAGFLGDITWLVESVVTGWGIFGDNIISSSSSFAILLSGDFVINITSLLVEIIDDVADNEGESMVKWRGLVVVRNVDEILEDAGTKKAKDHCLDGEFVPHRWWVID
jgi:hypothetical protein